ncbi:MAG: glycosyltransferase family 2 protein, partial [Acidimicrobiales bacterium]
MSRRTPGPAMGALALTGLTLSVAYVRARRRAGRAAPATPRADPDAARLVRERLDESVAGLRRRHPERSAATTFSASQKWGLRMAGVALVAAAFVDVQVTAVALTAVATTVYGATLTYRLLLLRHSLREPSVTQVTDDDARAVPDHALPPYTVLVPAYREPEVIGNLLASLRVLEYPRDRLDVKLLLEADDDLTLGALDEAALDPWVEVVRVPVAEPRTKPKACNFGLTLARGDLVTIYDAEDRPEPLQLRRAAVAFGRLGPRVACLQAKLSYYNPGQNLITKWFTVEYGTWFCQLLPGLVRAGAPLPLGGTSNHFRREVLAAVGAWDPYNVTEDADLGLRIHREGYKVGLLDSTTYEEANSDFVNWMKQRSRWYKGYLQTWLVHLRRPRQLWRDLGPSGFFGLNLFVGGTPLLALVNPVFWTIALLWFIGRPSFIVALFPGPVYYVGLASFLIGNFTMLYVN